MSLLCATTVVPAIFCPATFGPSYFSDLPIFRSHIFFLHSFATISALQINAAVDSKKTKIEVEGEVDYNQQGRRRRREDTEARYQVDIDTERYPRDQRDRTDVRRETRIYEERDRFDDRRRREDIDVNVDIDLEGRPADYQRTTFVDRNYQERDPEHRRDMGYYDEDGHYHSFRHGLHRAADRVIHPIESYERRHGFDRREEVDVDVDVNIGSGGRVRETGGVRDTSYIDRRVSYAPRGTPNTITIPCHHIRIGDLLMLQGRPCQVIRITTSSSTGQHRYLGVDLFTKQLFEESSFASNPSPSIYVQNMLGPVFKQYRLLDIRSDGRITAMTESGDIKQSLPVIDQSQVFERMADAFDNGRGSVRALVINDAGRELVVDYKTVHGSRL